MGQLVDLPAGIKDSCFQALDNAGWTQADLEVFAYTRAKQALALVDSITTPPGLRGMSTDTQLLRWDRLYRNHFEVDLEIDKLVLPDRKRGFDRLIVVAVDHLPWLMSFCGWLFGYRVVRGSSWRGVRSVRNCSEKPYAVWARDCRNADPDNLQKSALHFASMYSMTLPERLLFGIVYFLEHGRHLDDVRFTICAGSRTLSGEVPLVCFSPQEQEEVSHVLMKFGLEDGAATNVAVREVVVSRHT